MKSKAKRLIIIVVVIVAVLSVSFIIWQAKNAFQWQQQVQTHWQTTTLLVSDYSGCPYIVTHLEGVTQVGADGLGQGCVAQLPDPLVFIDSHSFSMSKVTFNTLPWVDSHGMRVPPPRIGSPVTVLYFKPEEGQYRP